MRDYVLVTNEDARGHEVTFLPCSKATLLHRPRMPNTGAANALPECMGEDYVVPLGALVFQATRRLSDAQSARQTSSRRARGTTGNWHMDISDSRRAIERVGCFVGWQCKREARAKVDAVPNNTTRRTSLRCTALPASAACVPAADARTSKAVGSLRRHPSVAQHHWACV